MAKTLFFIEALALALVAVAFPIMEADAADAFLLPLAISLALPLSCALAVWPAGRISFALRAAFSERAPAPAPAGEAARILEFLAGAARVSAPLGILLAAAATFARSPAPGRALEWSLLGAYLAAYALVNAQLGRVLSAVVGRLAAVGTGEADGFAAAHGLTPREGETASCIARGMSYKETAYELGISIKTVKAHMGRVYEKTGAASNVALALLMRGEQGPTTKVQ
jgi:DNA-binding CsgD family transcriptional regulator